MDFFIKPELHDPHSGQPIIGKFDVDAGLSKHDRAATCCFRVDGHPSTHEGSEVTGRLDFPEHATFTFAGSFAAFQRAIRKAVSWYELARDPRFDWIRD